MKDPEYEEGRAYRLIQQQRLIGHLRAAFPDTQTVLDVGAGTGMLVEEATRFRDSTRSASNQVAGSPR